MENVMHIILTITKHTFTIKIAIPTAITSIAANIYRYAFINYLKNGNKVGQYLRYLYTLKQPLIYLGGKTYMLFSFKLPVVGLIKCV
jgi:hypothetical protein